MNTANNKRRRDSIDRFERVFLDLIQTRELDQISVSELCKGAGLNRTTFYANYQDIYALADSVRRKLELELAGVYSDEVERHYHSHDYLKMFCHIRDNQLFYKTYFKLGYDHDQLMKFYDRERALRDLDDKNIDYHITFFRAGLTAILKKWLYSGCKESPEELKAILESEYQGRK